MDTPFDAIEEPQWQRHADSLLHYFRDQAHGKCLLWVNPAQNDPFGKIKSVQDRRVRVNIVHPRFDASLGPYLVPLQLTDDQDVNIFRASVEIAWAAWSGEALRSRAGQPVAGWIETEDDPRFLAHYWAMRCHLHRLDGQSWLLRFHDPGVREWLWEVLTEDQQLTLSGSALTVFGIARSRHLMRHGTASRAPRHARADQRLLLDRSQWDEVRNYATAHGAWLEWVALPAEFRKPIAEDWHRGVLGALSHAAAYGIADEQDRQLFALHALLISDGFHRSRKLVPVWEKTLAGEFYGSALEDVFNGPADQLHVHLSGVLDRE